MKNFFKWFQKNNVQIAWFLIGYFVSVGLRALAEGNYVGALIGFGFAGLNYVFNRH
jgi:hypothetical protein